MKDFMQWLAEMGATSGQFGATPFGSQGTLGPPKKLKRPKRLPKFRDRKKYDQVGGETATRQDDGTGM